MLSLLKFPRRLFRDTEASQILEFAVALPLLAVFIVGIYDFSGAFNLRQKLSNAAREGAHLGASQLTSDLTGPSPPTSIVAIRDDVDSYLQAAKVSDCSLGAPVAANSGVMTWTATGSCTKSSTFTLTVERAYAAAGANQKVLCTRLSISYPYTWQFNSVIQLLVPGAVYGTTQIATDAVFPNMN